MPCISKFFGIAIYMYYSDHAPPHFHAIYGEHEAAVDIHAAEVLQGSLPQRALSLVTEWATIYREELRENWELARASEPLKSIAPLD